MSAVLFGSIGTIADTSELQREAFNEAFAAHGLDWVWSREDYQALLEQSGGADRVAEYGRAQGQDVDAEAIHSSKSEIFRKRLAAGGVETRAGVRDTITDAVSRGVKVGLVTTTSPENVASLIDAVAIDRSSFDVIVDATSVAQPKPDQAAYDYALAELGEDPHSCVAIEDNLGGLAAARAADLTCVAFPGENNAGHDFTGADHRIDALSLDELQSFIPGETADGASA